MPVKINHFLYKQITEIIEGRDEGVIKKTFWTVQFRTLNFGKTNRYVGRFWTNFVIKIFAAFPLFFLILALLSRFGGSY